MNDVMNLLPLLLHLTVYLAKMTYWFYTELLDDDEKPINFM